MRSVSSADPIRRFPDFLDSQHVIETKDDADAYVARLHEFARVLDESTRFQQEDVRYGAFAPDFCLDLAMTQLRALRHQPAASTVMVESIIRRTGEKKIAGDWGPVAEKIVARRSSPRWIGRFRWSRACARRPPMTRACGACPRVTNIMPMR